MDALLLGSGHSVREIDKLDLSKFYVVAINHAHQVTNLWNMWFHASDYRDPKPKFKDGQIEVGKYNHILGKHGGHGACGYSVVLNASYYVLDQLEPKRIFYLGCDMNYTPDADGHTHFYGIGKDIQTRNISDPDMMAQRYRDGKEPEVYLRDLYMRFAKIAEDHGCSVWNLSPDLNSRLPYPKMNIDEFKTSL